MTRSEYLIKLANQRILLLDGAIGTSIQQKNLSIEDYSTSLLNGKDKEYPGLGELLNISRPDVVFDIHNEFLASGADIITTNTFCANRITLKEYDLDSYVNELNQSAVEIARAAAENAEAEDASRFVFVAGSLGPTGKMLSFSTDSEDILKRDYNFNDFKEAYREQALVLLETQCDILLIETVFDTLVCKAALEGIREAQVQSGIIKPIMVSVTFSDISGHTLSGQTLEAFCNTLASYPLFSLGMNCSMGATEMLSLIEKLSSISPFMVSAHPNAGLPLADGSYGESATDMVKTLLPLLKKGCLNIIGGCCGTTQEHIKALYNEINKKDEKGNLICRARQIPTKSDLRLCGLDLDKEEDRLMIVGERCNVAGSRKFLNLIQEENWEMATSIAHEQVEKNADVLDICMDSSMIDGKKAMVSFLRYINCDPYISKKPYMIDSSNWEVIETALGELQGRCIINSISLKEGEEKFIAKAKTISNFGHKMVVMLFDEIGQATTYERKIEIAKRSYNLLVANDIRKDLIIFDPNILTVATGIDESDYYALDFIKAVKWIKTNLDKAQVCGGVSNLSFSFRGNNPLRRAMHTVFLHYAKKAGLDFAIVTPSINLDIESINQEARRILEKALFEPCVENREKLIELASSNLLGNSNKKRKIQQNIQEVKTPEQRVILAICNGGSVSFEKDIDLLLEKIKEENKSPISIIEGLAMEAMSIVGDKFSKGQMFLPQVVKSARVMKSLVSYIEPEIEKWREGNVEKEEKLSKVVVFATVKGDVHDIGKNICILLLRCNDFEVIDLGVMVATEKIIECAIENKADLICLSGLITPSLDQMANVCRLAKEKGLTIPIIVGGATTSFEHTAIKLSPLYDYRVFQTSDASKLASLALDIIKKGDSYISQLSQEYKIKEEEVKTKIKNKTPQKTVTYKEAFKNRFRKKSSTIIPKIIGIKKIENVDIDYLISLINWKMLAFSYNIKPNKKESDKLKDYALSLLNVQKVREILTESIHGVYGIFPCTSDGLSINVDGREKLTFARQEVGKTSLSIADFVNETDYIGMYIVTAGHYIEEFSKMFEEADVILLRLIAIRLAEALSQSMEDLFEKEWGSPIIKVAPGYPSCPNLYHNKTIFSLLDGEKNTSVRLSDNYMMNPEASITSLVLQGEGLKYFNVGELSREQLKIISKAQNIEEKKLISLGLKVK